MGRGASKVKSSEKLNPYAQVYKNQHGGKFSALKYMEWINSKHSEFQKTTGAIRNGTTGRYDSENEKQFIKYLNQ